MPRKQKKSQAAKQRWKKFHEFHSVPTCEQAECDFPKGSAEDSVSAKTNADGVKQAGQHVPAHVQQVSYADAVKTGLQHEFNEHRVNHRDQPEVSSAPQVGYADIVKRGHHSDVAGRSHSERVNLENQPSVAHVCASHSQAHPKYGDSRNSQCTCNSITFLAFLHENDNMTTADLNLVLDKGDVMYKEAKKRFPKSIHLATDELPDKVDARRSMYHVDMTQPSRYGTFGEPSEEAVDTFLSLEAGLSCLLSDVQYALLIMSGLCIAVFRSTSGKYGFFDPHSRTASGLPLPLWSRDRGTAVMLKFTLLSDMIKRLQDSYEGMEISPSCNYELKPVQFYSMSTVNLSDTITDTVCRPTASTPVAPTHSDTTVDEANPSTPRRNTTTDLTENIFCQMSICTPLVKQKEVHMTQFTPYEHQNEPPNIPTEELCILDNTTTESSNVWMTSLNDKYKARPETPEYEEMCMADFAATCRIVYGQQTKGKDVLPLLNEMGFVQRRKNDKPAIIRFHRCSQEKHPEQYYGRLLKLYLPHRSDNELKTPSLPTYQAFYGAGCVQLPGTDRLEYVQHIVKRNREKYEKNSEEIESAVEEYEQNRGVTDEWCNLAPESDLVRLPLVEQEREQDNENEQEDVPDYSRQADASTEVRAIREPPAIDPTLLNDYRKDPRTGRMALQDRPLKGGKNELPDTLKVAEGARVMLTRNIDIQNGLVNGAFGKLLRVVYSENDQHIIKLGLKMDNETSGKNNRTPADNMVYIERAEENLKQKGVVRRQFPVKLAFACTIHKVQGMTTTSAVVSLKSIFEPGMAYVAVSRVTSLSGLYLLDMEEKKIFTNPEITAALENMRQANLDDMMPLLHVRQTLSRSEVFTIVHHNTEGLPAHINDIKSHHELCLADVLCLTETHLRGSFVAESLHLENYNLFKRNRHLSYTNFPQMANRSGGGVAVYVKSDIQVHEKQYIHNVTDLEFLALKVEAPVSALIAVVYRPPDYTLRPFLKNLS
ncbi:unnamed protein product [Oreochromis niloticus]|nr:unnamed protein product [Mustela putorius furo]